MMKIAKRVFTLLAAGLCITIANAGDKAAPAPNGIELPEGYKDWRVIASSHREDNNTLRVILGNDAAIEAARAGSTNPWPDGAILGKLVWKDASHAAWPKATVPGEFVHAEFMIKDSKAYPDTGGWGYARWKGLDQHRCYTNYPQSALPRSLGHPTTEELAEARAWGRTLIEKALDSKTPEKTDFWTKDNHWATGGWKGRSGLTWWAQETDCWAFSNWYAWRCSWPSSFTAR